MDYQSIILQIDKRHHQEYLSIAQNYYLVQYNKLVPTTKSTKILENGQMVVEISGYQEDPNTQMYYVRKESNFNYSGYSNGAWSDVVIQKLKRLRELGCLEIHEVEEYECGVSGILRKEIVYKAKEEFIMALSMMIL
jgi:hypothetical protein